MNNEAWTLLLLQRRNNDSWLVLLWCGSPARSALRCISRPTLALDWSAQNPTFHGGSRSILGTLLLRRSMGLPGRMFRTAQFLVETGQYPFAGCCPNSDTCNLELGHRCLEPMLRRRLGS